MKDKYEKPELSVINDDNNGLNPEPRAFFVLGPVVFVAGIAAVAVLAGGVYQVAGAVELYAAANAITAVTTQTTVA